MNNPLTDKLVKTYGWPNQQQEHNFQREYRGLSVETNFANDAIRAAVETAITETKKQCAALCKPTGATPILSTHSFEVLAETILALEVK